MSEIPKAPPGYQTCNVHNGTQDLWAADATSQINHLVKVPTSGPTLCGLTRFGKDADLPGWSMGRGVSGPKVQQIQCAECWASATPTPDLLSDSTPLVCSTDPESREAGQ